MRQGKLFRKFVPPERGPAARRRPGARPGRRCFMCSGKIKRIVNRKAVEQARQSFCELCGRPGPVHVHHIKSRGAGGGDVPENLISLCPECHAEVHAGLIPKAKLVRIAVRREQWKSAGYLSKR